ncbi:0d632abd-f063-4982-8c5d-a751e5170772 [Sclerotinia trifoliorum]|uniref:0d632abd-f063-4982-8c5d-a751e5170772 n=1 Tax=Sclerotinia trifoliorum TaxID=28548 RepID=A0A8H2W2A7_9HELO|nr:0d632abd-f063-4982-8c5d-a751e5170772 [Sclerotinia trifoliorum]
MTCKVFRYNELKTQYWEADNVYRNTTTRDQSFASGAETVGFSSAAGSQMVVDSKSRLVSGSGRERGSPNTSLLVLPDRRNRSKHVAQMCSLTNAASILTATSTTGRSVAESILFVGASTTTAGASGTKR